MVAALIQLGKAIRVGGRPLLGSSQAIWLANLVLGGPGMFLHAILTEGLGVLLSAAAPLWDLSHIDTRRRHG